VDRWRAHLSPCPHLGVGSKNWWGPRRRETSSEGPESNERRENVRENHTAEDGNPVGSVTSLPVVDEAGIAAARRYAGWHLGYRSWADNIVHAYLHPEQTNRELDAIQAP
jgi:hypothetical protein